MATGLLLAAMLVPIVIFWGLATRAGAARAGTFAIAIVAGWIFCVLWAFAAGESVAIAAGFGWFCPSVIVIATWLVWRFARRRPR